MFRNPYDTTVGMLLGMGFDKLSAAIQLFNKTHNDQVGVAEFPHSSKDSTSNWCCRIIKPGLGELPTFAHPVMVDESWDKTQINKDYNWTVYTDVRNFTRLNASKEMVVSSETDYNFAVTRAHLQFVWIKTSDSFNDILSLGAYPMAMYSRVISALLVRRFGLSPDIQMRINVILAYFYLCMFKEVKGDEPTLLDDRGVLELSRMITQGTYIPAVDIIPIITPIPVMRNIKDLVTVLKQHANTIRFDNLNEPILLELIATVWAGSNYREIAQVSLEHPPTWVAMIYTVLNQRGFANSYLAKTCKEFSKGNMDEVFVKNVNFLFR